MKPRKSNRDIIDFDFGDVLVPPVGGRIEGTDIGFGPYSWIIKCVEGNDRDELVITYVLDRSKRNS